MVQTITVWTEAAIVVRDGRYPLNGGSKQCETGSAGEGIRYKWKFAVVLRGTNGIQLGNSQEAVYKTPFSSRVEMISLVIACWL